MGDKQETKTNGDGTAWLQGETHGRQKQIMVEEHVQVGEKWVTTTNPSMVDEVGNKRETSGRQGQNGGTTLSGTEMGYKGEAGRSYR